MRNFRLFIIFYAIVIITMIQSCLDFGNKVGDRFSVNEEQSKEIGVFIGKYKPIKIRISDSIQFEITNIIAEKKHGIYSYDADAPYTIDTTKSQLVLVTEPGWGELWKKYDYRETWEFSNMRSIRKNTWVIDIDAPVPPDTVKVEVINDEADSTGGAGIHYGEKIGEFIIVKNTDD